jgi:hypothetical protein
MISQLQTNKAKAVVAGNSDKTADDYSSYFAE